jgi:hypothetical protein
MYKYFLWKIMNKKTFPKSVICMLLEEDGGVEEGRVGEG